MATSFPVSTCLVTAAWKMVTSAPKDTPHKKNAIWETPKVPLKKIKINIVTNARASMKNVKGPKWSSTNFPAIKTDTIVHNLNAACHFKIFYKRGDVCI